MKRFSDSLPRSKSFVDIPTRTTADLSLVEAKDIVGIHPELGEFPFMYYFNRLKSGIPGRVAALRS